MSSFETEKEKACAENTVFRIISIDFFKRHDALEPCLEGPSGIYNRFCYKAENKYITINR
ncbi:hypothetical protein DW949_02870 [Megasphaera sp. AM44-1BH]|nr:hypothetical protein DW949_02870 [Megasphaera sp. AM44-1BH]